MKIPQVINQFNVYQAGAKMIGVTGEVTLPEIVNKTTTIEGAGIPGSYDVSVLGNFDSIKMTIPFAILHRDMITLSNPIKTQELTLRGSIQVDDNGTGITSNMGMRVVVRGKTLSFNPGVLKQADRMNASVQIECMYLLIEVDGKKMIEIDKWNNIYVVDGVDLMEEVRKYC